MRAAAAFFRKHAVVATLGVAALVVMLGFGVERSLGDALGGGTAPATALGSAKLRRALVRQRLATLRPPNEPWLEAARPLPVGGGCPPLRIAAGPLPDELLPSSTLAVPWLARHPAAPLLVSLYLDPCRRRRLEAHPLARGRDSEETGWVSIYEHGRLRYASAVGVRVHGGDSRKRRPLSLRLYFRDSYGPALAPAALLDPRFDGTLDTVVLQRDELRDRSGVTWRFVEAITYDVARLLGAPVPSTRPVALSVDGEPPRVYLLVEHLTPAYLRRRFGHTDFDWVRVKEEVGSADAARRDELAATIAAAASPLTVEWAADRFDLRLLLDWVAAAMLCETGEPFQAVMVRDRRGALAGGRWSWVLWDLDQSFFDPPRFHRLGRGNDHLHYLTTRRNDGMPAGLLVRRLLREDPRFRRQLADRLDRALSSELTAGRAGALVNRYARAELAMGGDPKRYAPRLDAFFARRRESVRAEIAALRSLPGSERAAAAD